MFNAMSKKKNKPDTFKNVLTQ